MFAVVLRFEFVSPFVEAQTCEVLKAVLNVTLQGFGAGSLGAATALQRFSRCLWCCF